MQATTKISMYAQLFDENNPNWTPNTKHNFSFIRVQEAYLNDKLQARGHVFLNEVYDALGMDRTPAGAVNGWLRSNASHISFKYNYNSTLESLVLDFEVDGDIHQYI